MRGWGLNGHETTWKVEGGSGYKTRVSGTAYTWWEVIYSEDMDKVTVIYCQFYFIFSIGENKFVIRTTRQQNWFLEMFCTVFKSILTAHMCVNKYCTVLFVNK